MKAEFAWPGGDQPKDLFFEREVPLEIYCKLLEFIPADICGDISSIKALSPVQGLAGRYAFFGKKKKYFVRVSTRLGTPDLEKKITDYLIAEGVAVSSILFTVKQMTYGRHQYRIDVRELLDARHFNNSEMDIKQVATLLGDFHKKMSEFPDAEAVRETARKRYQRLADITAKIKTVLKKDQFLFFCEQEEWAMSNKTWLSEMVECFDPHFDRHKGAQCLHGELHIGNVLYLTADNSPVLIDFEESVHVYANPIWDFAFLFKRFCLSDNPHLSVVKERFNLLKKYYNSSSEGFKLPDVFDMIRQIAWFTVAVIFDLRQNQDIVTPNFEYEKFVKIENQARSYQHQL